MYWIIWLGTVILCLVLQTVYADILTIGGIKPDSLIVIIVYFSFRHSTAESGIIGFIAGILQDSLSGGTFLGVNAFTKLMIGLIASTIKKVYAENLIIIPLSIFVFTIIHSLLFFAVQSIFVKTLEIPTMHKILLLSLYNSVIGLVVFPLTRRIKTGEG